MTDDTPVVRELRAYTKELQRQIADLERQNRELREAVAALLGPEGSAFPPAASGRAPATIKNPRSKLRGIGGSRSEQA